MFDSRCSDLLYDMIPFCSIGTQLIILINKYINYILIRNDAYTYISLICSRKNVRKCLFPQGSKRCFEYCTVQ